MIMYMLFTVTITNPHKPDSGHALHGGWLIPVVATQSVAVLGAILAIPAMDGFDALWCALHVPVGKHALHDHHHAHLPAADVLNRDRGDITPPYWIDMGAVAITTLAGSTLAGRASWEFLQQMLPFLLGFTLLFWVTATWWIPLLLALDVWRHWLKRYPLAYDPLYWDIVFPLGMYATCTGTAGDQIAAGSHLRVLIFLALAAWAAVFLGLLRRIAASLFSSRRVHKAGYS